MVVIGASSHGRAVVDPQARRRARWRVVANRVYRGRATVHHVVNGYELNTTGQFQGRSWRRACVRRDVDRLGRFKTRGCTGKAALFP